MADIEEKAKKGSKEDFPEKRARSTSFRRPTLAESSSSLIRNALLGETSLPSVVYVPWHKRAIPSEMAVSAHSFARSVPSCWAFFIHLKRRLPRWTMFPIVLFLTLGVLSTFVVPLTILYNNQSATSKREAICASWASSLPNAQWYNANTTLNNLPRNLTFEVPAATTVDKLGNTALQCPLLSDGGIQYPTWISIFKDWEVFLAETSASPDVEEFLAYNTPSLKDLALLGEIQPTGGNNFNPDTGSISLTFELTTARTYPRVIPSSSGVNSSAGTAPNYFVIIWTVSCNGESQTCNSTAPCVFSLSCSAFVNEIDYHSWSAYPFDRYFFALEILASAWVISLSNPDIEPYQVAVPMALSFFKSTPAWHFNRENVSDMATLHPHADLTATYRSMASFFFPVEYFYGLPNSLCINLAFTIERTNIIITWAIFLDLMMWLTTLIQFILAIDVAWLRPRDVPIAQYAAAIALVFALPSIRNSQPGIPPFGIVADIGGFFWNEILCLAATVVLLSASYGQYSYGREMRQKHEAAKKEVKVKEEEDAEEEEREEENVKPNQNADRPAVKEGDSLDADHVDVRLIRCDTSSTPEHTGGRPQQESALHVKVDARTKEKPLP